MNLDTALATQLAASAWFTNVGHDDATLLTANVKSYGSGEKATRTAQNEHMYHPLAVIAIRDLQSKISDADWNLFSLKQVNMIDFDFLFEIWQMLSTSGLQNYCVSIG